VAVGRHNLKAIVSSSRRPIAGLRGILSSNSLYDETDKTWPRFLVVHHKLLDGFVRGHGGIVVPRLPI
jgi:hypothetical protein